MTNPAAALLDRLDTTVCVLTTAHEGRPAGCIVTYVTPASLHAEHPHLVVLTSHENLTHELLEESGVLALHPVARGKESWVRRFGFQSGRDVDKFAGLAWEGGRTGAPLLGDALGPRAVDLSLARLTTRLPRRGARTPPSPRGDPVS